MASWSLEAFLEAEKNSVELDKVVCGCIEATGDKNVVLKDHLFPFNQEKIGVRIEWQGWFTIVMVRNDPSVADDALELSKSRATPALIKTRLVNCNQSVRVIFGPDNTKDFTNYVIDISEFLKELSSGLVYDPQQKKFW
jgi:hypothetical protein